MPRCHMQYFRTFKVHLKFPARSWRYYELKLILWLLFSFGTIKVKGKLLPYQPLPLNRPVNIHSSVQYINISCSHQKNKTKFPVMLSYSLLLLLSSCCHIHITVFITISYTHYAAMYKTRRTHTNTHTSERTTPQPPTFRQTLVKESDPRGID